MRLRQFTSFFSSLLQILKFPLDKSKFRNQKALRPRQFTPGEYLPNGELIINVWAFNELIIKTDHKKQCKFTCKNRRGHKSIIHFIVINR